MRCFLFWSLLVCSLVVCVHADQMVLYPTQIIPLHPTGGTEDWVLVKFNLDPGLDTALVDMMLITGIIRNDSVLSDDRQIEVAPVSIAWSPVSASRSAFERAEHRGVVDSLARMMPIEYSNEHRHAEFGVEVSAEFKRSRTLMRGNGLRLKVTGREPGRNALESLDSLKMTILYTIPHPDFRER